MSTSPKSTKRKLSHNAQISPPPLRRKKVQSTTTQNAVASFFTPSSQKAPEKVTWYERAPDDDTPNTLLVAKYDPGNEEPKKSSVKRHKVAAFDLDSTLITTASGKKFASDASDWKWWHSSVPGRLRKLYLEEGFRVVILSNQGGVALKPDSKSVKGPLSKVISFKTKVSAVLTQLDIPISVYAATEKDLYRKPRTGMWHELLDDYDIHPGDLSLPDSIFVGDAGGRDADVTAKLSKDFSCSDRNFADNVGIKFLTPEEFFLGEPPRPFTRPFEPTMYINDPATADSESPPYSKKNLCDIVLLVGSPGAGKSSFYWNQLEPLGYKRINQDTLKTREKCLKVAAEYLTEGVSVAIDNTNPDQEVRGKWIALAAKYAVSIRCVLFTATPQLCEHNDAVRALNKSMNPEKRTILPGIAFRTFASKYRTPTLEEGLEDIVKVDFKFIGTTAQQAIWSRHWL